MLDHQIGTWGTLPQDVLNKFGIQFSDISPVYEKEAEKEAKLNITGPKHKKKKERAKMKRQIVTENVSNSSEGDLQRISFMDVPKSPARSSLRVTDYQISP